MTEQCREVNINGKKYVREDCITNGELRIVIGDRGWVFVGQYSESDGIAILANASIIRRWGTTKGLGELAEKGPLQNTTLDPCPSVRISITNIIATIDCVEESWRK